MKNFKIAFSISIIILSLFACKEDLIYDVEVEYAPIITGFTPTSGRVGDEVTIEGDYLQAVDSVSIGGGVASIKYLINSSSMVVLVNSESKSGSIFVSNGAGSATSSSDFTKEYPVPVINNFPATSKAYETIVIEGDDLDVVTAVSFDTAHATIITQQEGFLEVLVPFYKELTANIILTYPTVDADVEMASSSQFELEIVPPTVANCPDNAPEMTEITISGDDLYVVDSVMFGDYKGTIVDQGDTTITILVPTFSVTSTVEFSLHFFGNSLVAHDAFQVQVATLAYWSNKTIYTSLKDGVANTDSTFFDAVYGNLYSPCQWDEKQNEVHFFITISDAGNVRITAQDTDGSQIDNFSCSGEALATEITPNTMRMKRLITSDAEENGLITSVKNQTLEELNSAVLDELGIGNALSTFVEENSFLSKFAVGDVILFQQYNDDLTVVEYTGALEIVEITKSNGDTEASMNFNAYFGAY